LQSNETKTACLVKIYENFESFKINDIVEFVGIMSQDPSLAYMHDEHLDEPALITYPHANENDENTMEIDNQNGEKKSKPLSSFPPSLVPRLHCIRAFHLYHNNPLVNSLYVNKQKCNLKSSFFWLFYSEKKIFYFGN
jgi:hypothetical protein